MQIRLGYACISETLEKVTMSSSYHYTNFLKEHDYNKLDRIIRSNLEDLEKILIYNIKNNIHFFRLSSSLIPLATINNLHFDYITKYKEYYNRLSKLINNFNLRVDFHPDEYCVLNSVKQEVVENAIEILKYHYNILKALHIKNKILVLHIGSSTFGKDKSITRFINNFNKLPSYLQKVIAIENDDKTFTIKDCLFIASKIKIKVVLDYHHYLCNHEENYNLEKEFLYIFNTWTTTPKMHFSTPKNKTKKDFRSHNDYINSKEFIVFLKILKKCNQNIDIMIEAKKKDEALFRLIRKLKYETTYKFLDETSFII